MKKFAFIVFTFIAILSFAEERISKLVDTLIPALIQVESGGNEKAVGDKGRAKGALQLHKIYIDDANRIAKKNFIYDDAFDIEKSKQIVKIYLIHYGKNYEKKTGKKVSEEVLARIHNGGPAGYLKDSTKKYWNKISKVILKKQIRNQEEKK